VTLRLGKERLLINRSLHGMQVIRKQQSVYKEIEKEYPLQDPAKTFDRGEGPRFDTWHVR
jgi:hypothetical protein